MKVHFHYIAGFPLGSGEADYRPSWLGILEREELARWTAVEDPADADLVVVLESGRFKCWRHREVLLADPLLATHWAKCVTLNYEDNPAGFLPGLYANLPARRQVAGYHEAFCYLFPPAIPVERLETVAASSAARLLFSYRGAASHPVRERLCQTFANRPGPWSVRAVDRWYNHTQAEKDAYYEEIAASAFVLCPRGLSTTTHRLFEVMAMGKCPVIISDDWEPIPAVDWESCSIRVAEKEPRLAELLERHLPEAEAKGRKAREVWQAIFAYPVRFREALERLAVLQRERPAGVDLQSAARHWWAPEFVRANGWDWRSRMGNYAVKLLARRR